MKNPLFDVRVTSPLAKVFPDGEPPEAWGEFTALRGETVSFQVAYRADRGGSVRLGVVSPLGSAVRVRKVALVPCEHPAYRWEDASDENYLRKTPGLYPDLLEELREGQARCIYKTWQSVWVDVCVTEGMPCGRFPVRVVFTDPQSGTETLGVGEAFVTVCNATLPELPIMRTEWFHGDCLADYYKVPVFSEEHWAILERFIAIAARRDINMILTPHFTPPLDTARGGERTTIQLVGVTAEKGEYTFDFSNLERWVAMCRRVGVKYLEMSHLFTQWGAVAAPKVMATVDGEYRRLFGWETPAVGGEYTRFLHAYLPRLTAKLKAWGIAERTVFHISDEPSLEQYDAYRAAKDSVAPFLEGFKIVDALSNYAFYERGAVDNPVVAIDHIHAFIEHGAAPLWAYYCCGQNRTVSNRFMAMPSARARVYGAQLFKYDIAGALHWGYNFYNSSLSLRHIDPYRVTDADCAFPAGDPFLVYPGEGGHPEESLRMMTVYHAMTDLRALHALAARIGKERVVAMIEEGLPAPLTFTDYPKDDGYFMALRNRINLELEKGT